MFLEHSDAFVICFCFDGHPPYRWWQSNPWTSHRNWSLQETRKHHALDALFADWCLSGKGKTSCLVGGFWLGRNFWWAGGPWVLEMEKIVSACFFFRCLQPLLANCMILLRQILFKQNTILVNQHSCSWKLHLGGRTYIYYYRPSERALLESQNIGGVWLMKVGLLL